MVLLLSFSVMVNVFSGGNAISLKRKYPCDVKSDRLVIMMTYELSKNWSYVLIIVVYNVSL